MTYYRASLHNHTNSDPQDPIRYSDKELIDHAAKEGFKILAITCHNKWIGSKELIDYAEKKGVLLIPGVEKTIQRRHISILNCTEEAEKIHTFKALKEYKQKHPDCFIIANHPYFPGFNMFKDMLKRHVDCLDAVEFSWWYSKWLDFNKRGKKLSQKHTLPFIGTSDTHHIKWFGITHCEINTEKLEAKEIIKALHEHKFRNTTEPISILRMFLMPFVALRDKSWLLKEKLKKIMMRPRKK